MGANAIVLHFSAGCSLLPITFDPDLSFRIARSSSARRSFATARSMACRAFTSPGHRPYQPDNIGRVAARGWPGGEHRSPGCRQTGFFFPTRCRREFSKAAHSRRMDRATLPGAHPQQGAVAASPRVEPDSIGKWARHASEAHVRRDQPSRPWHSTRTEDPASIDENIPSTLQ